VARLSPIPALAILGDFDEVEQTWLREQAYELNSQNSACARLRYVSYAQAEADCRSLAAQLVERFGRQEIKRFRFTAMPRGGFIVLGMLAYALGLDRAQLEPPASPETPLVVVDDCTLSGHRFAQHLQNCQSREVVFAHLYSHPELRIALQSQEPRVIACLSAQDLHDSGPELMGEQYAIWQKNRLGQLSAPRYWTGVIEFLCCAWNEPNSYLWNSHTHQLERRWHILSPDFCLKNRPLSGGDSIPIQWQDEIKDLSRTSEDTLFGEFEDRIIIGDLKTGTSRSLADADAAQ